MKALNEMLKLQNAGKLNVLTVGKAKELRGKKIQILNKRQLSKEIQVKIMIKKLNQQQIKL